MEINGRYIKGSINIKERKKGLMFQAIVQYGGNACAKTFSSKVEAEAFLEKLYIENGCPKERNHGPGRPKRIHRGQSPLIGLLNAIKPRPVVV